MDSRTVTVYQPLILEIKLKIFLYAIQCCNCRHLIICGSITYETVRSVVSEFIYKDASVEKTDIVIIDM